MMVFSHVRSARGRTLCWRSCPATRCPAVPPLRPPYPSLSPVARGTQPGGSMVVKSLRVQVKAGRGVGVGVGVGCGDSRLFRFQSFLPYGT